MFDKTITNSDDFLELPDSSQVLYFHLSMNADDDGFINNWKSIMKMTGTKEDDLKLLIAKQYIIMFDSGVIVIRHWRLNNYLRNDRYKETKFLTEKNKLYLVNNDEYTLDEKVGIPMVSTDKNRIDKNSIDNNNINNKEIICNWNDYEKCECQTSQGEKCLRRSSYKIDGKNYCNQHSKSILGKYFDKEEKEEIPEVFDYDWLNEND